MKPGISAQAAKRLATLRPSFLAMLPAEALAFVEALRAKRIKPKATKKGGKDETPVS